MPLALLLQSSFRKEKEEKKAMVYWNIERKGSSPPLEPVFLRLTPAWTQGAPVMASPSTPNVGPTSRRASARHVVRTGVSEGQVVYVRKQGLRLQSQHPHR